MLLPMDNKEIRMLLEKNEQTRLFARVCTWSIKDILNEDLYKEKIKAIPYRFSSVEEYFQCFVPHLLEETRTELFSSFKSLWKAPVLPILYVETKITENNVRSSIKLFHDSALTDTEDKSEKYEPKCGDIIALSLTKERPRIDDLNPLLLAYVTSVYADSNISVQFSRSISQDERYSFSSGVFLIVGETKPTIVYAQMSLLT
ncbi:hypothetical protein AtEden1_Chr5g0120341 [Arabidopsis thaliana]